MSERNGKYYTLAVWNFIPGVWTPEFGDHDYKVVKDEFRDMRDHGLPHRYGLIFWTKYEDGQQAIDDQIKRLPHP